MLGNKKAEKRWEYFSGIIVIYSKNMPKYYSPTIRILGIITLIAFISTQCGISYAYDLTSQPTSSKLRVKQIREGLPVAGAAAGGQTSYVNATGDFAKKSVSPILLSILSAATFGFGPIAIKYVHRIADLSTFMSTVNTTTIYFLAVFGVVSVLTYLKKVQFFTIAKLFKGIPLKTKYYLAVVPIANAVSGWFFFAMLEKLDPLSGSIITALATVFNFVISKIVLGEDISIKSSVGKKKWASFGLVITGVFVVALYSYFTLIGKGEYKWPVVESLLMASLSGLLASIREVSVKRVINDYQNIHPEQAKDVGLPLAATRLSYIFAFAFTLMVGLIRCLVIPDVSLSVNNLVLLHPFVIVLGVIYGLAYSLRYTAMSKGIDASRDVLIQRLASVFIALYMFVGFTVIGIGACPHWIQIPAAVLVIIGSYFAAKAGKQNNVSEIPPPTPGEAPSRNASSASTAAPAAGRASGANGAKEGVDALKTTVDESTIWVRSYNSELLICNGEGVLFSGLSGTGKSSFTFLASQDRNNWQIVSCRECDVGLVRYGNGHTKLIGRRNNKGRTITSKLLGSREVELSDEEDVEVRWLVVFNGFFDSRLAFQRGIIHGLGIDRVNVLNVEDIPADREGWQRLTVSIAQRIKSSKVTGGGSQVAARQGPAVAGATAGWANGAEGEAATLSTYEAGGSAAPAAGRANGADTGRVPNIGHFIPNIRHFAIAKAVIEAREAGESGLLSDTDGRIIGINWNNALFPIIFGKGYIFLEKYTWKDRPCLLVHVQAGPDTRTIAKGLRDLMASRDAFLESGYQYLIGITCNAVLINWARRHEWTEITSFDEELSGKMEEFQKEYMAGVFSGIYPSQESYKQKVFVLPLAISTLAPAPAAGWAAGVALVVTDRPAVDPELAAILKERDVTQIVTKVVSGAANALGQINEISEDIKRINPDIIIVDITSNATGLAESILSLPGVNAVILPEDKTQWRAVLTAM